MLMCVKDEICCTGVECATNDSGAHHIESENTVKVGQPWKLNYFFKYIFGNIVQC